MAFTNENYLGLTVLLENVVCTCRVCFFTREGQVRHFHVYRLRRHCEVPWSRQISNWQMASVLCYWNVGSFLCWALNGKQVSRDPRSPAAARGSPGAAGWLSSSALRCYFLSLLFFSISPFTAVCLIGWFILFLYELYEPQHLVAKDIVF